MKLIKLTHKLNKLLILYSNLKFKMKIQQETYKIIKLGYDVNLANNFKLLKL